MNVAPAATSYLDPEVVSRLSRLDLVARLVVEGFITGLHEAECARCELIPLDGAGKGEPDLRCLSIETAHDCRTSSQAGAEMT